MKSRARFRIVIERIVPRERQDHVGQGEDIVRTGEIEDWLGDPRRASQVAVDRGFISRSRRTSGT
jgi:hypothetical protein